MPVNLHVTPLTPHGKCKAPPGAQALSGSKWCCTSMFFEFDVHTGLCVRCLAPSLSSKTVMHVSLKPGKVKVHLYRKNITALVVSVSATYPASVVGKRNAFLRLRKPAHAGTCAHYSPTGNLPPVSGLACVVCVRVHYQLKPTSFLNSTTKVTRGKRTLQNTNRTPPVKLPRRICTPS